MAPAPGPAALGLPTSLPEVIALGPMADRKELPRVDMLPVVTLANFLSPGGCGNKVPQTEALKQQRFILWRFWRPEVGGPGVGRAALAPKALGEGPSCLFRLLVAPGVPGLVAAARHLCLQLLSFLVSVSSPLLAWTPTGRWI